MSTPTVMRTKPENRPLLRDWVFAMASIDLGPSREFVVAPPGVVDPLEEMGELFLELLDQRGHRGAPVRRPLAALQSPAKSPARYFRTKSARLAPDAVETIRRS